MSCNHTFHRLGGIDDCPECNPDGQFAAQSQSREPTKSELKESGAQLKDQPQSQAPAVETRCPACGEDAIALTAVDLVRERDELKTQLEQANAELDSETCGYCDFDGRTQKFIASLKEQLTKAQAEASRYREALEILIHEVKEGHGERDSCRSYEAAIDAAEALQTQSEEKL